jgi:hypothetical protein
MSTTISQSQTTFENAVEKLSELEHFFITKLREIEQRESDSHRKRSREPENSDGDNDGDDGDDDENRISKKRYKHKKFSYRWMNHFTLYQS